MRDIKSGEFLKKAKEHERKAAVILEKAKGQSLYQRGLAYRQAGDEYGLAHYQVTHTLRSVWQYNWERHLPVPTKELITRHQKIRARVEACLRECGKLPKYKAPQSIPPSNRYGKSRVIDYLEATLSGMDDLWDLAQSELHSPYKDKHYTNIK